jgi:hypothetical protein
MGPGYLWIIQIFWLFVNVTAFVTFPLDNAFNAFSKNKLLNFDKLIFFYLQGSSNRN